MSRPAPLDAPVARLAAHDAAGRVAPALLLALTGFIALQPMSTDLYLPSLPAIAQHFGLGAGVVQQTLTVFMLASRCRSCWSGRSPTASAAGRWRWPAWRCTWPDR
jgi:DHA1 family bicyclomycin/chloramphenicol resistance-like MFS transporter